MAAVVELNPTLKWVVVVSVAVASAVVRVLTLTLATVKQILAVVAVERIAALAVKVDLVS